MRVLVGSDRGFNDNELFSGFLRSLDPVPSTVIQDGECGAANLANKWTRENGLVLETYSAEWRNNGVLAGRLRNQRMLDEGKPDLVVIFGQNSGIEDLKMRAQASRIEVVEVMPQEPERA
jgi:hypothetical protein